MDASALISKQVLIHINYCIINKLICNQHINIQMETISAVRLLPRCNFLCSRLSSRMDQSYEGKEELKGGKKAWEKGGIETLGALQ